MTTEIKPTNGVATDAERGSRSPVADEAKRKALRDHLDRKPPRNALDFHVGSWRDWFDEGEYLGVASGRTGPDPVSGVQPCTCDVCQAHRTATGRVETVGGDK